jgi:hypothetical protein
MARRSDVLTACVESVGHVLGYPAGGNQNDIEADFALRVVRVMREPKFSGCDDAAPGPCGDGFCGVVYALARLDLDEGQHPPPAGDNIDFSERRFPAPGQDAVALGDKEQGGAAFGGKPKPESRHPLGPWPRERGRASTC